MGNRELNDALRRNLGGKIVLISQRIIDLGILPHLYAKVEKYDDFSPDDREHDEGKFYIGDYEIVWQIIFDDEGRRMMKVSLAAELSGGSSS